MHKRFVKLVRDGIPQFVGDSDVVYEPIEEEAKRIAALRAKLIEESVEYLLRPSIGELSDVLEVVHALAKYDLGVEPIDVMAAADSKVSERGAFDDGLGMYVYTTAGAEHEGEHAE